MKQCVAAAFFLFVLAGCTANSAANDIYLIPQNYEGNVYAFYNVKGAPEIQKEGDYQVYAINEEGYFATSTPDMDYRLVTDKYYYVDENGERTRINEDCVRGMGAGSFENGPESVNQIKIKYTGIEVTKNRCGQEFKDSGNGMAQDDVEPVLAKVVARYYGVDLIE